MDNRNPSFLARKKTLLVVVTIIYLYPIFLFSILAPLAKNNAVISYILTIISALVWGILGFWAIHQDNISLETIGLKWRKIIQAILILLLGWTIFAGILFLILKSMGGDIAQYLGNPLIILQQWLFTGISEELLFRGYLLTILLVIFTQIPNKMRSLPAILIANFIFASSHLPVRVFTMTGKDNIVFILLNVLILFFIGLGFSILFLQTHNIVLIGLIHGGMNAPLIGQKGDFMPLIILIIIVELWIFIQNKRKKESSPTKDA